MLKNKTSQLSELREGTSTMKRSHMVNPQLTPYPAVKTESYFCKIRNRQGCPLLTLWFNIVLDLLTRAVRQEKKLSYPDKEDKMAE